MLTQTPEESLVQTVLVNGGRFRLVDDDLRYIDYEHTHRGSPRTLTVADVPRLASGKYHFARKFDLAVDAEVLDRIDREILEPSSPRPSSPVPSHPPSPGEEGEIPYKPHRFFGGRFPSPGEGGGRGRERGQG